MPRSRERVRASASFNGVEAKVLHGILQGILRGQTAADLSTDLQTIGMLLRKAKRMVDTVEARRLEVGERQEWKGKRCEPVSNAVFAAYMEWREHGDHSRGCTRQLAVRFGLSRREVSRIIEAGRLRLGLVPVGSGMRPLTPNEQALVDEYVKERAAHGPYFGLSARLAKQHGVHGSRARIICLRAWRKREDGRTANQRTDSDLAQAAE